jgi:hypothetical protein
MVPEWKEWLNVPQLIAAISDEYALRMRHWIQDINKFAFGITPRCSGSSRAPGLCPRRMCRMVYPQAVFYDI